MSLAEPSDRSSERSPSQTVTALLSLRELIVSGALKSGERISELAMVDRIGVSRTPLRTALVKLEQEGLIEEIPSGGYAVKAFSEADVFDAIEIRGTLEGLAARYAAERGVATMRLAELRECVAEIDTVITAGSLSEEDFEAYLRANERFHTLLMELSGSPTLRRELERVSSLPFASASAFVKAEAALPESRSILPIANEHHRAVVDAIENREGARAEAIMREHARLSYRNLMMALRNQKVLDLVPGAALIRRRS
ncbi:GntR family transcriptional regulator [Methylocella sp. CPCC 101449]|jgi:GntR family transcriptional regulator of vanillate catabolism|uniref:GntR family transcriptional regulator n=1 Tax=Methylocella sp. CPCC 101449 TaxID=2987531 RepID=UPI00095BF114|nr:GntR family transcriptional regulator [Methylocella sp. CPCC 101449]MBN9081090.1 GntR family transcriptional regulator [Hyphomicrobiales bacterium]MDT2019936.1 GntR family transcriptional regulator [Methylocella sp. CPCC 101449]OJY00386.1 MAG: GntR family transcriptional regulator [Rhizobiales bacterium 62-17]HEV2575158.1 GntR family transcriptional regulator [Beijerinckiaceae bacterium]